MKKILLAACLLTGLYSPGLAQVAPPVTTGLKLNLDGSVGYVPILVLGGTGSGCKWQDQSGNGNDVSSTSSTTTPYGMSFPGGYGGVEFDGVDDILTRPALATSGLTNPNATIFIVRIANTAYMTSTWNTMLAIGEKNTFNNDFSMMRDWAVHSTISGNWVHRDHSCFPSLPDCFPAIVTGVMRTGIGAGDLDYYVNGVISTNPIFVQGSPAPYTSASRGIAIGGSWGSTPGSIAGTYFRGSILKVLAYDRVLTATEIDQVHQYLKTRYSVPNTCGPVTCDPDFSWTMSTASTNTYTFNAQHQNLPYTYEWQLNGSFVNSGPSCMLNFPATAPTNYKICLLLRDCDGQEVCRQCIDFCHSDKAGTTWGCTPDFTVTSNTNTPMDVTLAPVTPGGSYIWTVTDASGGVYAGPSAPLPSYTVTMSPTVGLANYSFTMQDPANPSCSRGAGVHCFSNNSPSPYKIAPLQDEHPLELVSVVPNPASTLVTVQLSRPAADPLQLRVSDMSGRTVYTTTTTTGTSKVDIPLQGLATGMYIVQIQGKAVLLNAKFVKQ